MGITTRIYQKINMNYNLFIISTFISSSLCLNIPLESLANSESRVSSNVSVSCPTCILAKSSSQVQTVFPWLFNNYNARFMYSRTDDEGYPVYSYTNAQHQTVWLHFYDEGLFYDGFYVINDLEDGYEEVNGRVFIYNSDHDDCPQQTERNWYYWSGSKWIWDESIYVTSC